MQRAMLFVPEHAEVASIAERFGSVFHSEFNVFSRRATDWAPLTTPTAIAPPVATYLQLAMDTPPSNLCVHESAGDRVIVVPVDLSEESMLVVGQIDDVSNDIALSIAEQIVQTFDFDLEKDSLAHQLDDCSAQISRDFEELTSLRELVKCLHLRGAGHRSLARSAEAVLPLLLPSLNCEEVALVTAINDECHATGEPITPDVVRYGNSLLTDEEILALADKYGQESSVIPIVNNMHDEGNVKGFIITAVCQQDRVWGWLLVLNPLVSKHTANKLGGGEFGTHEANVLSSSASILATHASNIELLEQNEQLLVSVTRSLVATLEAKDLYTRGHSERVALYAKRIATELGFDSKECERIYLTGLLHDIGKIAVPDATLNKKGRLTEEEMNQIRRHPEAGWNILRDLEPLRYVLPGVLYHHERMDGKGYPHQLSGEDIPLAGRILAVADAYDAMTSDRSYREGLSQMKAENLLRSGSGSQWDMEVICAAFDAMTDLVLIRQTYYAKQVGIVPGNESKGVDEPVS